MPIYPSYILVCPVLNARILVCTAGVHLPVTPLGTLCGVILRGPRLEGIATLLVFGPPPHVR